MAVFVFNGCILDGYGGGGDDGIHGGGIWKHDVGIGYYPKGNP